ncbi:MAG: carboxypeptidase regulatory-like domain-containing protein [Planctomycetes bacterium]|nr:carboxypeptidase regulatory-like domain-containing protein [Planctomycetota bacterium]
MRSGARWIAVVAGVALVVALVLLQRGGETPAKRTLDSDPSARTATLSVLLRDLDGVPLRGARVNATRARLWDPHPEGPEAISDATGRARFASLGPGDWVVHIEGLLSKGVTLETKRDAVIGFTVPPIARVEGVVVDETGTPLRGASVRIHKDRSGELREVAATGADGQFAFDVIALDCPVSASCPGHAPSRPVKVEVFGGETVAIRFELTVAPFSVSGVVVDSKGRAVAGARVVATRHDGRTWNEHSDERGAVTLDGMLAGILSIDGFDAAHGAGNLTVTVPPGGMTGLELGLGMRPGLEAEVVSASGGPVEGARVLVSTGSAKWVVFSNAEGRVVLRGLPAGRHRVEIIHPEHPPLRDTVEVRADSAEPARFVVPDAVLLRGEIVDESGRPLSDMLVVVVDQVPVPITDRRGAFVLPVPAGGTVVDIHAPELLATPVLQGVDVRPSAGICRIVVPTYCLPSAHIRAVVKRPEGYEDEALRIALWHEWHKIPSVVRGVSRDALLRFGPLPPGRYSIRAYGRHSPFNNARVAEILISPGQNIDLGVLSVPDPVVPELRARTTEGHSIRELRGFLVPRGRKQPVLNLGLRDGRTSWDPPLEAGEYRLLVDDGEGYRGTEQLVTLRAGPPNRIELVLQSR